MEAANRNNSNGTSANNGKVLSQTITVPGVTYSFNQTYTYDTLNRLATASETYNGATTWSQTYGFDRYGNRNITAGNGATSLDRGRGQACNSVKF